MQPDLGCGTWGKCGGPSSTTGPQGIFPQERLTFKPGTTFRAAHLNAQQTLAKHLQSTLPLPQSAEKDMALGFLGAM